MRRTWTVAAATARHCGRFQANDACTINRSRYCVSSVVVGEQLTFVHVTSAIDAIRTDRNAPSSKFNRCYDVSSNCSSNRLDPDIAWGKILRVRHAYYVQPVGLWFVIMCHVWQVLKTKPYNRAVVTTDQ